MTSQFTVLHAKICYCKYFVNIHSASHYAKISICKILLEKYCKAFKMELIRVNEKSARNVFVRWPLKCLISFRRDLNLFRFFFIHAAWIMLSNIYSNFEMLVCFNLLDTKSHLLRHVSLVHFPIHLHILFICVTFLISN